MTHLERIEARLIAIEMLFRGMLTGIVTNAFDPMAEVERMAEEFASSAALLSFKNASGDDHAEQIRAMVKACVDDNFNAVRSRALRHIEIKAAQAGRKN